MAARMASPVRAAEDLVRQHPLQRRFGRDLHEDRADAGQAHHGPAHDQNGAI
jgi:hypothetical protein